MLAVNHLTKKFGKKLVLDDLSYTFSQGVYGLLGPNGAGKTTLMRCLTKLYSADGGDISYNGVPIKKDKEYLTNVGYLPQKFGMFKDLKVLDMMRLFTNFKKVDRPQADQMIRESLETVNLSDRINSRVGALSGGMIRRLGIAQAMLGRPKIIIFDEPTAGLDPEERLRFKNIIAEIKRDKIIIISTHIVEDVEAVCDQVAVMESRNIAVSGSCQEIQDIARNKVYVIAQSELSRVQGEYQVQKQFEQDGVMMLKILTGIPQSMGPAAPTVEDGYICALKNI